MSAFDLGWVQGERRTEERNAKKEEERQAELANIANAGLTPEATQEAIRTLYQKEPSALKQHIANLIGRMHGKAPQQTPPAYSPQSATVSEAPLQVGDVSLPAPQTSVTYPGARTQEERRSQILSGGTTPEQRRQAEIEARAELRPAPREPLAPYKVYVSPDGKDRQSFRVGDQPEGWQIAPPGGGANVPAAKPLEAGGIPYGVQTPNGTFFANQMNDPNTPLEVKQVWSSIQEGLKAKQDEQDKKQREADERQLRGFAAIAGRQAQTEAFQEAMAEYRSDLTTYRALDKQAREAEARAAMYEQQMKQPGNKSAFDTALVTDYTGILAKGGRKTQAEINFAQKIGGMGLRADRMMTQAMTGELPDAMRQMYIEYMKTSAASDRAEADAAKPTPPAVGKKAKAEPGSPAPKTAAAGKPIVQHSPSTGKYRYSLDGGKTWQPGQPPSQ